MRRIRAAGGLEHTYIIALSAVGGEIRRSMAFDAGRDDFVAKPFLAARVAVLAVHFSAEEDGTAGS